jgi:tetratricopeptide (TPR) repeat protein
MFIDIQLSTIDEDAQPDASPDAPPQQDLFPELPKKWLDILDKIFKNDKDRLDLPANFLTTLRGDINEFKRSAGELVHMLQHLVASLPASQTQRNAIIRKYHVEIIQTIRLATGLTRLIEPIFDMLDVLIVPLEQMGYWKTLEPILVQIFPLIADDDKAYLQLRWAKLMFEHSKVAGLRVRLDTMIKVLEDGKVLSPQQHNLLRLVDGSTDLGDIVAATKASLRVAEDVCDYPLMLKLCGHLAYYALEREAQLEAFAYAQQALILATYLGDRTQILDNLTYMAAAFHQHTGRPEKAVEYFEVAVSHAEDLKDRQQLLHLKATKAFCLRALHRDMEVVEELDQVLPHLNPKGFFYARVLMVYCIAKANLDASPRNLTDVRKMLRRVLDLLGKLQLPNDSITAHLVMAEVLLLQEARQETTTYYRKHLQPHLAPESTASPSNQHFIMQFGDRLRALGLIA